MAKFANKEDEIDALKECINCGSRNILQIGDKLHCGRCGSEPDKFQMIVNGSIGVFLTPTKNG